MTSVAPMDGHYKDIEFSFQGAHDEDEPIALGSVTVRAEGTEIALQLADADDGKPFCLIVGKPDGDTFVGINSLAGVDAPTIEARWSMQDREASGTWVEGGVTYAFTFALTPHPTAVLS